MRNVRRRCAALEVTEPSLIPVLGVPSPAPSTLRISQSAMQEPAASNLLPGIACHRSVRNNGGHTHRIEKEARGNCDQKQRSESQEKFSFCNAGITKRIQPPTPGWQRLKQPPLVVDFPNRRQEEHTCITAQPTACNACSISLSVAKPCGYARPNAISISRERLSLIPASWATC